MKPKSTLRCFLILAGSSLLAISHTQAANIWDGGGGDANWNTVANWDNNALPGTGALTFTGDVQTTTNNDLTAALSYSGISFTNDGSSGKTNAFTLAGASITLNGNITTTANTTGSTITDVISLEMILNNNRTVTTNQQSSAVQHNLTFSGVVSQTGGNRSLTKLGLGTLTLNGSVSNTFTGGLTINGGNVALDYANMVTPTDLVASNVLTLRGSNLLLKGKTGGGIATAQTLGNVTVAVGGNTLLINPNGGDSTTLALGTFDSSTQGASMLVGKALGAGSGTVTITTTTNKAGTDIYKPRFVFADGTAAGYDWATTVSGGSPFTLSTYGGYSPLDTTAGTDTLNSRITASATLGGSRTTNTLKIQGPAASQSLDLAGNTLTLAGGGLLVTGTNAFQITGSAGSKLIGQNGAGSHDLIVHQFNSGGLGIGVEIANNGATATALTKSGTGTLTLSGSNTFTGGLFINSGEVRLGSSGAAGSENNVTMSNSGILSLNGSNVVVKSLASVNATDLNGDAIVQNANAGAATLTVGNLTSGNTTFTGIIQDGSGGGALSLIKTGAGIQTLSGTPTSVNTYSGGTTVSGGGILELRSTVTNADVDGLLGAASGGITLSGGGELRATGTNVFAARIVTIGTGGGSLRVNKNNAFTTSGKLTGSSTLTLLDPGGTGIPGIYNFNSTSNDFTGGIVANNAILGVNSLQDVASNIVFNSTINSSLNNSPALRYGSAAITPLTLSSRAIEFNSAVTSGIAITNNNTTHAINIGSNLIATGASAKTLTLDAVAGPANVFSGNITDGSGTVALAKSGAGTWTLSGNNSYTGATTVTTSGSTLVGIGANAFGSTSGISLAGSTSLSLRGDSSTTFTSSNVTTTASAATLNVDQATIAGVGAKTMTMGTLGTSSTAATYQVNFTGANNTSLSAGALSTPVSTAAAVHTINNNISVGGSLTLASVFNQATTIASPNLAFAGAGNTIVTGAITQTLADMDLIKSGTGTLTLNASSTYTGSTSITGGTLVIKGATHSTNSITFSGGGVLGLDVASPVTAAGATVNFTGQQVLVTGTPTLASYTLLTASSITSTPTLAVAVPGYILVADSTTLKLNSTGAPVGYAAWQSANSTAGGRDEDHDNDGVDNGTEHFLGGTAITTGFTPLPGVVNNLGVLSVTYVKAASYTGAYNTDYVVETSSTLAAPWTPIATNGSPNIANTVHISGNNVTYTFPAGTKNFARLKVTGP